VALGERGGIGRGRWRGARELARVAMGSGSIMNTTRFQAYGGNMYLFDQTFRTLLRFSDHCIRLRCFPYVISRSLCVIQPFF